ncbi:MAG: zinc-ribbon domain-containing protein [Proteobacteria bacterium]|nr:zinc-ribbon domain-containing protein [Pseudomonadota bacterium]
MIIQCDKCQSKFKIDDSKVTVKGVKVKCKKCANLFTVYPTTGEKIEEKLFEEKPEIRQEPKKEEISFDLPSFEFTMEEKKEEKTEIKEETKEEFSWDQFNLDISEKKPETTEKEEVPLGEELKFDFESTPEPKKESEEVDLSFDFDKLETEKKDLPEETVAKKEPLEEFIKSEGESKETFEFNFSFEEKKEAEVPKESEKETESFSFDSFGFEEDKKEEKTEEKSFLDEFKFEETEKEPEESFQSFEIKKEPEKEEIEGSQGFDFVFQEEKPSEKKESKEDLSFEEDRTPDHKEELNFTFLEEDKKISFPQEEFTKTEEEPKPLITEEVKPKSGILTFVVSLLIIILFSGTGVGFVWWQKTKILETEGSFGISEVKSEFYESKTLGNVFVVKGKITNGYRVPKSFLKVKCVLYDKSNKKLAEKIAFASNVFTKDEIRELTYAEIEKGLNNKMGKSMMNVDVSPGKAIPFMIIFDKIPEGVSYLEVEAI